LKKIVLVLISSFFVIVANAQYVNLKGTASIKIQGPAVTPDEKDKAITSATMNAIERYFSEKGESQNQTYDSNEEKIQSNLEKLVQNTNLLSEQLQADTKRYQITVKIELNEARLKNIVKSGTPATMAVDGQKSNIVYVFIARQANSVKSYDSRVVKIGQSTINSDATGSSKVVGTEGEKISGNQISTNASKTVSNKVDVTATVKNESGGSVTNKRDEIGYQILPMAAYKPSVTSIFTQSGFSVLDSDFVLNATDLKGINSDFANGNDISTNSLKNIAKTLQASKEKIKYFVMATIDVGLGGADPSSGMKRVGVQISARVINVESGIPKDVASVAPIQQASLGTDEVSATTTALKKGAEIASREIISQLNNAGIK
jgi:hypothetical protein